ncbi:hypothetical protein KFK09_023831 [Dendrobium nobile]|uniref:H(+)-transporting two-sector ATPase n=1 Tax=Dendrobium nobile TaxID=94219 RepID=A0A8T3ABB6_DENNO|nr:hypothetical protein KFK09_023831 [Dendrobium nobile]
MQDTAIIRNSRRRTHEGNDLYMEMEEYGVINEKNLAESKVALVYGQMNEPPGARMRVGLTALTMAEYFWDEQDILLLFGSRPSGWHLLFVVIIPP